MTAVPDVGRGQRVLVTGSAGFIDGYVVEELLASSYAVSDIDNYPEYGPVIRSYDSHPAYTLVEGGVRDVALITSLLADCDRPLAGAAMIGGISYFHTYPYNLLATNERIIAATCHAAIESHAAGRLKRVTHLSSSLVFESTSTWSSKGDVPVHLARDAYSNTTSRCGSQT